MLGLMIKFMQKNLNQTKTEWQEECLPDSRLHWFHYWKGKHGMR